MSTVRTGGLPPVWTGNRSRGLQGVSASPPSAFPGRGTVFCFPVSGIVLFWYSGMDYSRMYSWLSLLVNTPYEYELTANEYMGVIEFR